MPQLPSHYPCTMDVMHVITIYGCHDYHDGIHNRSVLMLNMLKALSQSLVGVHDD